MKFATDIRRSPWLLQLIPLLFGVVVLTIGLLADDFEYDTDEGINLMKSLLLSRGHLLYSEIWSDQPPAFTYALVGWFKVFGMSVSAGRGLVLATSILLLVSLQQTLRILENHRIAWVAVLLLAGSNWYALYSFSVMIGLPALGVAMAAVWLGAVFRKRGGWWIALLAGVVFGISVQTKAFTLVMLPMVFMLLLAPLSEALDRVPVRRRLVGAGLFVVGLAFAFSGISLATGTDLTQLTHTHVRVSELNPDTSVSPVLTLMRRDWMIAILATTSLVLIARPVAPRHLLPFVWFACAGIVLHNHWPVWRHHSLLLMIPAAWAAARMAVWLWDRTRVQIASAGRVWSRVGVAIVVLWGTYTAVRAMVRLVEDESGGGPRMVALLEQRAAESTWVYADRLMPAFRTRLGVPPPLAVVSVKRQRAGELSDEALVGIFKEFEPAQLLLGRLAYGSTFQAYVDAHYTLTYRSRENAGPEIRHYLRNDAPHSAIDPTDAN